MFHRTWALAALGVLILGQTAASPGPQKPADSQPAARPGEGAAGGRRPQQSDVLRDLLLQQGRNRPVPAKAPETTAAGGPRLGPDGQPLLLEGTFLIERPGRLVYDGGRPRFEFMLDDGATAPRIVELLPNQLLETLEQEARLGFSEFVISAEVTQYQGANYLILRKVLRRVSNGNLGP